MCWEKRIHNKGRHAQRFLYFHSQCLLRFSKGAQLFHKAYTWKDNTWSFLHLSWPSFHLSQFQKKHEHSCNLQCALSKCVPLIYQHKSTYGTAAIRCHDSFEWSDNGHPKVQTPLHHDSVSDAASPDGEVIIQGRVRRLSWLWRGDVTMNRTAVLMLWPAGCDLQRRRGTTYLYGSISFCLLWYTKISIFMKTCKYSDRFPWQLHSPEPL